jgi:hypothetical protein
LSGLWGAQIDRMLLVVVIDVARVLSRDRDATGDGVCSARGSVCSPRIWEAGKREGTSGCRGRRAGGCRVVVAAQRVLRWYGAVAVVVRPFQQALVTPQSYEIHASSWYPWAWSWV